MKIFRILFDGHFCCWPYCLQKDDDVKGMAGTRRTMELDQDEPAYYER
jgi:hypothetical protein